MGQPKQPNSGISLFERIRKMRVGVIASLVLGAATVTAALITVLGDSSSPAIEDIAINGPAQIGGQGNTQNNLMTQSETAARAERDKHDAQRRIAEDEAAKKLASDREASDQRLNEAMRLLVDNYVDNSFFVHGENILTTDRGKIERARELAGEAGRLAPSRWEPLIVEVTAIRAEALQDLQSGKPGSTARYYRRVRKAADDLELAVGKISSSDEEARASYYAKLGELLTDIAYYDGEHKQQWLNDAVGYLTRSIEIFESLKKGQGSIHFNLSKAYAGTRNTEMALKEAERALTFDGLNPLYKLGKVVALAEAGKSDEAEKHLGLLLGDQSGIPIPEWFVHSIRATNCLTEKAYQKALEHLNGVVPNPALDHDYECLRAQALLGLGRLEEARQQIRLALGFDVKDPLFVEIDARISVALEESRK